MRKDWKVAIIFLACLVGVIASAVTLSYILAPASLPKGGPQYSVYTFTPNGNHTQFQISYSNGVTTGLTQVQWLSFDNKTGLDGYVSIKDEDCFSTNIENSPVEFQVRVDCNTTGIFILTRNGNHTRYETTYSNGASSGPIEVNWLSFDNKTGLGTLIHHPPNCVPTIITNTTEEYRIRMQC
jgi:hypothetical protein